MNYIQSIFGFHPVSNKPPFTAKLAYDENDEFHICEMTSKKP
jgi:hypothetical protein